MSIYPEIFCIFAGMNNFDYTSVPGELLYCDRRHLDDFGVDDTKTLNYLIENELYNTYYRLPDYEYFAVDVFNTAYYICTMALADSHPHRKFGAYLLEIKKKMQHRIHGVGFALSVISLQINAHQWDRINPEMSKFGLCVFYEIEREYSDIYKTFYTPVKHNYDERKEYTIVPPRQ